MPPVDAITSIFGYLVEVPEALTLFALTMLLLFMPKIISVITTVQNKKSAEPFCGRWQVVVSALLEKAVTALLAPINMLFNSKFVLFILLGQGVSWVTQNRGGDDDGDWREAILTHAPHVIFGLVWGASSFVLWPAFFWWLSPVVAGMVFSIPLSIILSKVSLGQQLLRWGLFMTPEETNPPFELKRLRTNLDECYKHMQPIEVLRGDYGLLQAVLDPYVNAVHVSLLRQRKPSEESRDYFLQLRVRLLREGPSELTTKEKMALLLDAESMLWLHRELWRVPSQSLAEWWRLAVRQYNVLTAAPITALYR